MMIVYFIYVTPQDIILRLDSTSLPINNAINNDLICMTIQAHTVLQKLFLGIKITTQGNYVTLIIILFVTNIKTS